MPHGAEPLYTALTSKAVMFTPFVSETRYLTCFNPDLAKVATPVSDVPTVAVKVCSSAYREPPVAGILILSPLPTVTSASNVISVPVSVILESPIVSPVAVYLATLSFVPEPSTSVVDVNIFGSTASSLILLLESLTNTLSPDCVPSPRPHALRVPPNTVLPHIVELPVIVELPIPLKLPTRVSFSLGDAVPIPTLPPSSIVTVPPSVSTNEAIG